MTISARIIADSMSPNGVRITTYELEYPRFIHAEFMTHRLFSRNAASSRAIPVATAIKLIIADTAMPIHWGKNQPGMSAKEECNEKVFLGCKDTSHDHSGKHYPRENAWKSARDRAIFVAEAFNEAGYHKQIVNRLLEPFTHIKVVLTATEYDNFFWLRKHPDAQPEIQELAEKMWEARQNSKPFALDPGMWHVPYYMDGYWEKDSHSEKSYDTDIHGNSLEDAIAISASCCAQVSYRKTDDSLEKARDIYKRLVESKPVHASPFEHQATPIGLEKMLPKGVTHQTFGERMDLWSGNFRGWIQNRQLIQDNACWKYDAE